MPKIINISGVIGWDATVQDLRDALNRAGGEEVEIHISSPGGFVSDGLEMFNLLRDYPGPISGVLKGYAMSMGSYIPLAIPLNRHTPGKLRAEGNAVYMIHNALGGVWGNHHKVLAYGETLQGMSRMIAREYSRRTGKSVEDAQAMMDKETYLFGEQIKEHGFVDEIMDVADESDADEASAKVSAQTVFTGMMARMTADQARMESDLQAAARMLAMAATEASTPPSPAGITNKEDQQTMTLAQLLAQNPGAKAEHDALIVSARAEGEKAGSDKVEARITAAAPFISNPAYGDAVSAVALQVIKGEESAATLKTTITVLDAMKETAATAAATTAAQPATPAAPVAPVAADGIVSDDAGLEALKAQMKGGA